MIELQQLKIVFFNKRKKILGFIINIHIDNQLLTEIWVRRNYSRQACI